MENNGYGRHQVRNRAVSSTTTAAPTFNPLSLPSISFYFFFLHFPFQYREKKLDGKKERNIREIKRVGGCHHRIVVSVFV